MEKQQKSKSAREKPRTATTEGDTTQPGNKPRQSGGSGSDIHKPAPAPRTRHDPLVHPGDQQDVTPDVIAGQSRPSKPATRQHGEPSDPPDTHQVGGQGNARP